MDCLFRWFRFRARDRSDSRHGKRRHRLVAIEPLEARCLLATAEGAVFALSEMLDIAGVRGDVSASIAWGDGSSSNGVVTGGGAGPLNVRIDYSLDEHNFFDAQNKRDLLQLAADMVVSHVGDSLAAITPSGGDSWSMVLTHPATGKQHTIDNPALPANELVVYAAGRELGGVGIGGPGGWNASCSTSSFCELVATRGQTGASGGSPTDFGPWGGSISFDLTTDWHFGETTVGLDNDESDFLSVAVHEMTHLLGFGTSAAWQGLSSNGFFTGAASRAANGGNNVALSAGGGHWASGTTYNGQEAAMDPAVTNGTRKLLTDLDLAGLDDIGWELVNTKATVAADHVYADNGTYDISVVVSGSTAGSSSASLQQTVDNVAPALTVPDNLVVATSSLVTIGDIGVFTDAGFGPSETFTYTIDWGDGTPASSGAATIDQPGDGTSPTSGSFDGTHTYASDGVFTVTVTVQDDDAGSDVRSFQVTASSLSWHNSANPFDVNGDTDVSAIDALLIINDLNRIGPRELGIPSSDEVPPFVDVNNDGHTSAVDVLQIINFINGQASSGEGEFSTGQAIEVEDSRSESPSLLNTVANLSRLRTGAAASTRRWTSSALGHYTAIRQLREDDVPVVGWPSKAVRPESTALEGHRTGTFKDRSCLSHHRPDVDLLDQLIDELAQNLVRNL